MVNEDEDENGEEEKEEGYKVLKGENNKREKVKERRI